MEKPSYIPPNYTHFMIIKFFNNKCYMDQFISGRFYMNCLSYFWNIIEEHCGRSDIYEGTEELLSSVNGVNYTFRITQSGEMVIFPIKGDITEKSSSISEVARGRGKNAEKKILSFYSLWLDFNRNTFLKISPKLKKLGKYAAFIVNTPIFLSRIIDKAKLIRNEMNSDPVIGFVRYINKSNVSSRTKMNVMTKIEDGYIYQNEFRISFDMKNITGPYEDFIIKNDDICVPVLTEDLLRYKILDIQGRIFSVSD